MARPVLWIVIPCYNEEQVLPITAPMFLKEIQEMTGAGKISENSRILFVNDGSADKTWEIISDLAAQDEHYIGICQSRNRGHQNAVLAGLMEAKDKCDITISIDCDGQDDISAMDRNNLRNLKRMFGEDTEHKISLLMDYTHRPGDVADPWYTGDFEATWVDVLEGCKGLLAYLKGR